MVEICGMRQRVGTVGDSTVGIAAGGFQDEVAMVELCGLRKSGQGL